MVLHVDPYFAASLSYVYPVSPQEKHLVSLLLKLAEPKTIAYVCDFSYWAGIDAANPTVQASGQFTATKDGNSPSGYSVSQMTGSRVNTFSEAGFSTKVSLALNPSGLREIEAIFTGSSPFIKSNNFFYPVEEGEEERESLAHFFSATGISLVLKATPEIPFGFLVNLVYKQGWYEVTGNNTPTKIYLKLVIYNALTQEKLFILENDDDGLTSLPLTQDGSLTRAVNGLATNLKLVSLADPATVNYIFGDGTTTSVRAVRAQPAQGLSVTQTGLFLAANEPLLLNEANPNSPSFLSSDGRQWSSLPRAQIKDKRIEVVERCLLLSNESLRIQVIVPKPLLGLCVLVQLGTEIAPILAGGGVYSS